jgi:hypothetical protein
MTTWTIPMAPAERATPARHTVGPPMAPTRVPLPLGARPPSYVCCPPRRALPMGGPRLLWPRPPGPPRAAAAGGTARDPFGSASPPWVSGPCMWRSYTTGYARPVRPTRMARAPIPRALWRVIRWNRASHRSMAPPTRWILASGPCPPLLAARSQRWEATRGSCRAGASQSRRTSSVRFEPCLYGQGTPRASPTGRRKNRVRLVNERRVSLGT